MAVSIPLIKETLANMSEQDLSALGDMYNDELYRRYRHGVNRPPQMEHPIASTRDVLVERYGLDGRKLLPQVDQGYHVAMPQYKHPQSDAYNFTQAQGLGDLLPGMQQLPKERYSLDELPFTLNYDDTCGMMILHLEPEYRESIRLAIGRTGIFSDIVRGDFEILIEPNLNYHDVITLRNTDNGLMQPHSMTLYHVVAWYSHIKREMEEKAEAEYKESVRKKLTPTPVVPVLSDTKRPHFLTTWGEQTLVSKVEDPQGQFVWETAPVILRNSGFDLYSLSNMDDLVRANRLEATSIVSSVMRIKSIYVKVGKQLLRLMMNSNPYASFVKNPINEGRNELLQLDTAIKLDASVIDVSGNALEFVPLLGDNYIRLDIRMDGDWNKHMGLMQLEANVKCLTAEHENLKPLADLLEPTVEILAVDFDAIF